MAKSKNIDMLHGSLWDKMVIFALPLALTGMLQQLYNAADVVFAALCPCRGRAE